MEKDLEFKIGNVIGDFRKEGKFIVCNRGGRLTFYAAPLNEFEFHKDIAAYNGVEKENVLGGGKYRTNDGTLQLYEKSYDFGSVPKEVAHKFADLLESYTGVKKVKTQLEPVEHKYARKWRNIGLKVNNIDDAAKEASDNHSLSSLIKIKENLEKKRKNGPLGIYIVQTREDALEAIQDRLKERNSTYNNIFYSTTPGLALSVLEEYPEAIDLVITGEVFYKSDSKLGDDLRVLLSGNRYERENHYKKHFKKPTIGPSKGSDFSKEIHELNPRIPVFRYSMTPGDEPIEAGYSGDISKHDKPEAFLKFLESEKLGKLIRDKNSLGLVKEFPDIKFYHKNLRDALEYKCKNKK